MRQMKEYISLSKRLRSLRKQKRLTQVQVAKIVGVGITVISRWENRFYSPNIKHVATLCDLFDVTPMYLLYGQEKPPTK